jgi:hypothetical protein
LLEYFHLVFFSGREHFEPGLILLDDLSHKALFPLPIEHLQEEKAHRSESGENDKEEKAHPPRPVEAQHEAENKEDNQDDQQNKERDFQDFCHAVAHESTVLRK